MSLMENIRVLIEEKLVDSEVHIQDLKGTSNEFKEKRLSNIVWLWIF